MRIAETGLNHREHREHGEPGISDSDSSVTSVSSGLFYSGFRGETRRREISPWSFRIHHSAFRIGAIPQSALERGTLRAAPENRGSVFCPLDPDPNGASSGRPGRLDRLPGKHQFSGGLVRASSEIEEVNAVWNCGSDFPVVVIDAGLHEAIGQGGDGAARDIADA